MSDDDAKKLAEIKARHDAEAGDRSPPVWTGHADRDTLLAMLDEATKREAALRRDLINLICRINRDGGHAMTGDLHADAVAADLRAAETNADLDGATKREAALEAELRDTTWQDHADQWQKRAIAAEAREAALRKLLERASTYVELCAVEDGGEEGAEARHELSEIRAAFTAASKF